MPDEESKAVQEIAKATGKGIDAIRGLGGFLREVFGPGLLELGGTFQDWSMRFRYTNWLRHRDKVEAIHRARRNDGKIVPVPPRFVLPLLEKISLEDNDSIQDMWAGLVANASDPQKRLRLKKVFVDILSSIEPLDALVLKHLDHLTEGCTVPELASRMRMDDESIEDEEVRISVQNLARLGCIRQQKHETWTEMSKWGFDVTDPTAIVVLTDLGISLLEACADETENEENEK